VIEAPCGMLDLETDPENWSTDDYASALRERFGLQSGQLGAGIDERYRISPAKSAFLTVSGCSVSR